MAQKTNKLLSTSTQLSQLAELLSNYALLPFSPNTVPGKVLEGALAHIRGGKVLGKYDFVDVVDLKCGIGWQVKSTLVGTPITWKRVKLERVNQLILESESSTKAIQELGNKIVATCNEHARKSFELHQLEEIGYARLIIHKDMRATYFERSLCTRESPEVFHAEDFKWSWSKQKETKGKEQLSALHGTHIPTGVKWFAWHGRGENQLHFSGEGSWWPTKGEGATSITFKLPTEAQRLSIESFVDLLANANNPLPRVD